MSKVVVYDWGSSPCIRLKEPPPGPGESQNIFSDRRCLCSHRLQFPRGCYVSLSHMISADSLQVQYFYPILILQQWQHIFYYSTWDKSGAAKVSNIWYQYELMNWNIAVSREWYLGPVLIGTGAGGISWILFWELLLICQFIWPTRKYPDILHAEY